jgi:hypothetical protein
MRRAHTTSPSSLGLSLIGVIPKSLLIGPSPTSIGKLSRVNQGDNARQSG